MNSSTKKKIGLYPGSFDPITNGHLDIIQRASKIVDLLVIGVAENKKKEHLFSMIERKELIEKIILKNKKGLGEVKVMSFDDLLMKFAVLCPYL